MSERTTDFIDSAIVRLITLCGKKKKLCELNGRLSSESPETRRNAYEGLRIVEGPVIRFSSSANRWSLFGANSERTIIIRQQLGKCSGGNAYWSHLIWFSIISEMSYRHDIYIYMWFQIVRGGWEEGHGSILARAFLLLRCFFKKQHNATFAAENNEHFLYCNTCAIRRDG